MILRVDALKSLYRSFIERLGGSNEEAAIFADRFVVADLRGMDWQGLKSLDMHVVDPLQRGFMRLGQEITLERNGRAAIVVEAHGELGQVACSYAMELAIRKAEQNGSAAFVIRHSGDTGLLASYTLSAIKHDCIGLMFNNTNPYIAPWGGDDRVHGVDPLSIAIPAGDELPVLLDMSITPGRMNFDTDETWTRPFKPPPVLFFETLREYLLSVTLELISGALTSMPLGRDKTKRGESAVLGLALHIPHFIEMDEFRSNSDAFIKQVKSTPVAAGTDEILLPGERGFRAEAERLENGIPIDEDVWRTTLDLAQELGVDWKRALSAPDNSSDPSGSQTPAS